MEARFFSDTALENFKDEAELFGFGVGHEDQGTRDVTIPCTTDEEGYLRALVYSNGGDVIESPQREKRKRERRKRERRKVNR